MAAARPGQTAAALRLRRVESCREQNRKLEAGGARSAVSGSGFLSLPRLAGSPAAPHTARVRTVHAADHGLGAALCHNPGSGLSSVSSEHH